MNHLNIMCPIKYIRIRTDSPPWITQEIIEAINDRNRLYRIVRNDNSLVNISNARTQRNRVNRLINMSKATYIKETLENNRNNPKKFWRILNDSLLKGNNMPTHVVFSKDDTEYTNIDESCDFMNDYFSNIGRRLHSQFQDKVANLYERVYNYSDCDNEIVFSCDDIMRVVHSIDVYKGSGIDYAPTFILKDCFRALHPQLTYLFNQSIALGTFPDSWKLATVIPIPKTGIRTDVKNWRPISILPLIGKLMENLCNSILIQYLETKNILCDEQFGFRKNRSTSLAIFNYIKYLTDHINTQHLVGSMYIDFARTFDSINHTRLIDKLFDMGVPGVLVVWIEDYLNNRNIRTKLNNTTSLSRELLCGVPQGSILGPTLFLCYINDLVFVIRELGAQILLYADDAVIYHGNTDVDQLESVMKQSISVVSEWCAQNYINVNVDKTKFCIYSTRSRTKSFKHDCIIQNNQTIMRCYQYNYLGVLLDECLNLNANFNNIFKKYSYKIFQFGKIKRYINLDTRILVYKQTILPLVEYVSYILCLSTKHDVDKLQKLQNGCLRMCFDIKDPRDMSVSLLHSAARINKLDLRRDIQLLNIMFILKSNDQYKRDGVRNTRSTDKYIFQTDIGHMSIYDRSPYIKGVSLWNHLPENIQQITEKHKFKNKIKRHFSIY